MPGVKRKENGMIKPGRSKVSALSKKGKHDETRQVRKTAVVDEEEDDFDDDENLLATALEKGEVDEGISDSEPDEDAETSSQEQADVDMYSDEDLEGGFEDVSEAKESVAGPSSKTKKKSQKSLYAIPSREELSELKGTTELFKSNIFKLKMEEMLKEVRPAYDDVGALGYVLRHLKTCIEGIVPIAPSSLPQARKELKRRFKSTKVSIPFPHPQPSEDSPLKYGYERPASVQMGGSWILKTATIQRDGLNVDMVVTMPSSSFQEKDHMNFRYFYKRAFYLAVLGAAIAEDPTLNVECSYESSEDDARRPVLAINSLKDGSACDFTSMNATIRVHLAHEPGLFPVARLAPSRNCIRGASNAEDRDEDSKASSQYNAAVLRDGLFLQHLIYLHSVKASCPEFTNAVALLKVWTSQRAFSSGRSYSLSSVQSKRRQAIGCTSVGFLLTMVLAHLLLGTDKARDASSSSISRLSSGFSSYQLFRGVMDYIAEHDFKRDPVFMKHVQGISSIGRDKIDRQSFVQEMQAVFVDPTGSLNLFASLDEGSLGYLQHEARATVALLQDAEQDHFEALFLRDRSSYTYQYDDVVEVSLVNVREDEADVADVGSRMAAAATQIVVTIDRALTNRRKLVSVFASTLLQWKLNQERPAASGSVDVAIRYDQSQAFRLVDHGPRPEDTVASAAFKDFWGELSELRRFRDGRVVESVVWTTNGAFDRLAIPRRIVSYVLKRHHSLNVKPNDFLSSALQDLLLPNSEAAARAYVVSPSKVGFQPLQTAFDGLVKDLRALKDLPLELISVVAADAALRSTNAMIPGATNMHTTSPFSSSYVAGHEFVMTFESSGQWPDDLVAIRAMKMAFYESMASKLVEKARGTQASVVMDVDAGENKLWDAAALEIVVPSGFAFRGRIHHVREETLLQRILDDSTESEYSKSDARAALQRYDERFVYAVQHHNQMSALLHRFPSFGEAVRLLERWINGQMFGNQIARELIELIVASTYIEAQQSADAPATGTLGFFKALKKLAEWEWKEEPLAVPLDAATSATPTFTMSGKPRRSVDANFEQIRRMDVGMHHFVWFIATEQETKGVCWAANQGPSTGTADGIQRLARLACQILDRGSSLPSAHVKGLFLASTDRFDFIIRLEPGAVTRYIDNIAYSADQVTASEDRAKSAVQLAKRFVDKQDGIVVGLNTGLEFVNLLHSLYSDSFRLYYDTLGGTVIGGLFNPALMKHRPFRVGLGFNSTPVADQESKNVTINRTALLEEIRRLGADIILDIERQTN